MRNESRAETGTVAATGGGTGGSGAVEANIDGRIGRMTLRRPERRNALTLEMVEACSAQLGAWASASEVEVVVVDLTQGGSFCGSDLAALSAGEPARTFWRAEYSLSLQIAHYPKPLAVICDGVISRTSPFLHASHRIATERASFCLSETSLGFIPDAGGTWLMARAPGEVGTWLALTGVSVMGADAVYAGLADGIIPAGRLAHVLESLASPYGGDLGRVLSQAALPETAAPLARLQPEIDRAFRHSSAEAIAAALSGSSTSWAGSAAQGLAAASPAAVKLTLGLLRSARASRSLPACLSAEHRIACRLLGLTQVVTSDQTPLGSRPWGTARLEDIDTAHLDRYRAPLLPDEELVLSPRA